MRKHHSKRHNSNTLLTLGLLSLVAACSASSDDATGRQSPEVQAGDAPSDAASAQPVCGDGVLSEGELCDDGNAAAGDGCSELCEIDAEFVCSIPGDLCTSAR